VREQPSAVVDGRYRPPVRAIRSDDFLLAASSIVQQIMSTLVAARIGLFA
jgi:hypothetical protein